MEQALEECWTYFGNLYKIMLSKTKTITGFYEYLNELRNILQNFQRNLINLSKKLHTQISEETGENDSLIMSH